jgi:hypothetical protein
VLCVMGEARNTQHYHFYVRVSQHQVWGDGTI